MFLNNNTYPLDFFKDNKPCDTALLNVHCPNRAEAIYDIQINNVRIINTYFDMKESFKKNPNNWFNMKYNLMCNLQNLVFSKCNRYPGFQPLHVCNSYKKSTFEEIWEKEFNELDTASKNKFRTMYDVNQWLMKDWQIASNAFCPSNKIKKSKVVYLGVKSKDKEIKAIKKTLNSKKYKFICVNDGYIGEDFDEIKSELKAEFEKKFPFKSSFEK
jgi:hypothetical protein